MTCALCVPLICATLYITDGDTIRCDGEAIRLMGFDTPETRRAKCEGERVAGYEAKARLSILLKSRPRTIERHGSHFQSANAVCFGALQLVKDQLGEAL